MAGGLFRLAGPVPLLLPASSLKDITLNSNMPSNLKFGVAGPAHRLEVAVPSFLSKFTSVIAAEGSEAAQQELLETLTSIYSPDPGCAAWCEKKDGQYVVVKGPY